MPLNVMILFTYVTLCDKSCSQWKPDCFLQGMAHTLFLSSRTKLYSLSQHISSIVHMFTVLFLSSLTEEPQSTDLQSGPYVCCVSKRRPEWGQHRRRERREYTLLYLCHVSMTFNFFGNYSHYLSRLCSDTTVHVLQL